jgi:hypothetical protein
MFQKRICKVDFLLIAFVILLGLFQMESGKSAAQERKRYNFNPDWLVFVGNLPGAEQQNYDDKKWKRVSTPYAWNEDSAYRVSIHDLPTGVAWYRKHFTLPREDKGKRVIVEFEGIRQAAEIYINGVWIARHEDGITAFGVDITDHMRLGENVLAVQTNNKWDYKEKTTGVVYQWNSNAFYANYGGISKNVWLHVLPKIYQTLPLFSSLGTTGVYVWKNNNEMDAHKAEITAESEVKNDTNKEQTVTYLVEIHAPTGDVLAQYASKDATRIPPGTTKIVSASSLVSGIKLWSWGYGYLYDVVTTLQINGKKEDRVVTRTGFRETDFKNGMIYLNGRIMQVHGYAQRTTNEWPSVGSAVPAWMSDFSNRLMVKGNANLVRWMHVTPWKQDVESCDRVGLPEALPAGDAEGDVQGGQWEQRVKVMKDVIVYNRNNPSVMFYESGNKEISAVHMAEMKSVRDKFDPHGGRAIGSREMLSSSVAEYGGEMLYINKSSTKPLWAHEFNRDEGARKFQDNYSYPFHKDSPLYNRNQDSSAIQNVRTWWDYYRVRPGTGNRVSSGGVNIIFSDSNTHYRGDNNYRRSGEVDAMRIPKEAYYANQVMWSGWVDPEQTQVHILGHWNYKKDTVKPVYAVSSAKRVELVLNGRSLGIQNPAYGFLFTFNNVKYEPGKLEAYGLDNAGKHIQSDRIETSGSPRALRLALHTGPGGLHADGADMALLDVEVVDADGKRCPLANNLIHFKVEGSVDWRGGIAQGNSVINATDNTHQHEDNYILSKDLPVEAGINRAILRATRSVGTIRVLATAEGIQPAEITFSSLPVHIVSGLSSECQECELPYNLDRGPTPLSTSVVPSRRQIKIFSSIAGTNNAETKNSFDDNEMTSWTNAVQSSVTDKYSLSTAEVHTTALLSEAWIEYQFSGQEAVREIDLKLNGFRKRRYPLTVLVDGKEVWRGITETNLGYWNLRLPVAARGSKVRIALNALPIDAAPYDAELNGNVDESGNKPLIDVRQPILSVIEAEFFSDLRNKSNIQETKN